MPEAQKTPALLYRHWVSFASGEQPFAVVLPERRLYDAFASWLHGDGPQGYSFPHEGQEMSINFAHVQRMEVEEVKDASSGTRSGGANPVPITEPPAIE
ncbi:MAG TPA: hypothetical protein VKA46_01625 [Gemmataceae bacterium]|nr:hypothetical protein [Gemmataceae bacterium]